MKRGCSIKTVYAFCHLIIKKQLARSVTIVFSCLLTNAVVSVSKKNNFHTAYLPDLNQNMNSKKKFFKKEEKKVIKMSLISEKKL